MFIAGVNYWPELTGIAPYTSGLAERLAAVGVGVVVLTAMPSYPMWQVFDRYRRSLRRVDLERGVEVRRFRTYVPARQSAARRAGYELTYLVQSLSHGALRVVPDAVIGVIPSLSGGIVARLEARRYRCPYGLIVQDLMGPAAAQSGISGGARVAAITEALEGNLARGASMIGVISNGFRPYLEQIGVSPDRIVHIPNWSHLERVSESRSDTRARLGWPAGMQIVLHSGNMGLKQGLEHILATARLALVEEHAARFVLMGDGSQRRSLEAMAADLPNVEFLDLVDNRAYPNILAAADVLLVSERSSMLNMSLPSKLTSYFTVGRPVLAAVPEGGATAAAVLHADAGIVVPPEDPGAVLVALQQLDREPDLAARLGAAGAAFAEKELSQESCLGRLEAFVNELVRSRPERSPWG